ncbi:MAG: AAA-like domain-containing protein [Scytolyngbya sp. HA4215-MV1]|jgi:hypothetical protein|nr:AAA-like domain-containing protein [Scytolyngbya sp. HA4215-MV1]
MTPVTVFFSYSHRDEKLRDKLALHLALLQKQGVIQSWHDRKITAGMEWAQAIDDNLNSAEIILLLVSDNFLASDYCYDIEMQRAMERHAAQEALVVPIILKPVDWSGAPFGKLQAFPKDAKPVTKWSNRDEAFTNIAQGIRTVATEMAKRDRPPTSASTAETALELAAVVAPAAVPAALRQAVELEELGGQVPLGSPFYVERPPVERDCYAAIVKPGALLRIKAPRQMGKSSLTIRILQQGEQQGYRGVWLTLQRIADPNLADLDSFLQWLCDRVTRKLRLSSQVGDHWQGRAGSMDKCTDFFELEILEVLQTPLVLCLDEVDEVFKYPEIAADFLGLLRSWHEESKISPLWQNLRLVITHSEEVYIPLDINQSPFNVGVPIDLPPLTLAQLTDLTQRHGLTWNDRDLAQLMAMVGGHPYLTRLALQQLALGAVTLAEFLQVAPTQAWLFGNHLRRHLGNVETHQLGAAMKQVVSAAEPVRLPIAQASKLVNMGLVRFQGNDVVPLCDLYRQYFQEMLRG